MKKRILLLLVAMIGLATSVGLAEDSSVITHEFLQNFPNKPTSWNKGYTFVYANGNPITITEGSTADKVKISVTNNPGDFLELDVANNPVVFGGSKNAEVSTSTITMTSGKVYMLFGGGYGATSSSSSPAKVAGSTNITISGGTISNVLLGGGLYYAQSKDVVLNLSGTTKVGSWLICGGFESGVTSGTQYVNFNNTVESVTLDITGGTYCIIALGGTDGDKGKTTKSVATVSGATITGGVYGNGSNGCSDDVTGTFTNCTFSKIKDPIEIAAVNRGIAKKVSLTFNNCTFPENAADIYANLGATFRWKYNYNGSTSKVEGVPGEVTFVFDDACTNVPVVGVSDGLAAANVTLTGAKAVIDKFEWDASKFHTNFTMDAGKTWTFNNGLEIANDVTFTNNGALTVNGTYTITKADQLATAVSAIAAGGTINLAAGTYELASNPLVIDKAITLQSATSTKAVIKGCIVVEAEGTTIKDLAFEYAWTSSKYSDKTGIAVFGNSATITGNTFTTSSGDHGTNGIVFYPKTATAADYVVTGNTFSLNQEGSTAIMVRENFKSTTQIPGVGTTAILPNGSVVDASVMGGKNIFTTVNGLNYCRLTGDYSVLDGTGSGDETITQKYLYAYTNADNLVDVLTYSQAKSTINLSGVTADALQTALNNGEKKALTAGICILCSDATVYTDMASAQLSTTEGTVKYIKLESSTYSLEIPKALIVAPTIKTKPAASTIEAGQPLSASILTGGEAKVTVKEAEGDKEVVVSGVFSWMDPSTQATVGTKSYKAVFTPTDLTKYEVVKDIDVEIKDVKQYYTVTIGKCENGKIEVTDGNSAGKYEDKKVLAVKAIPNDHYDFSAWGTGITVNDGSYTVSANAVLTATFVAKNYAVTIGDNVKVTKQDGSSVTSGASLPYGTVLNVVAAPTGEVGSLKSLTCNDKEVINNTVTVDGALNIQAAFNAFVPSTYRITAGTMTNGKIQLFDTNGNAIAFGSALTEGTVVSVVAVPDPGYELDGGVTVADATYENGKFTVGQKAVTVSATFKPKKYKVEIAAENATITLDKTEGLDAVDYGTSIKITEAKAADDYKLLAVVVNGKEIAKGESFTVKGATTVNAVVQKLPEVVFADKEQTYIYNKAAQAFVVRTVPAGISGITITYQKEGSNAKDAGDANAPTDAGIYKVFASLTANSSYASMDKVEIGTLTIEKAPYPAAVIPTASNIKDSGAEYEYHWRSEAVDNFRTAYYKLPANSNYREPEFVIPATSELEGSLTKVTLGEGWITTRANKESVSLTLSATGGSVSAWLGDALVTNETTLYAGQKLTFKAIPADASYSTRPTWSGDGIVVEDGVASITLSDKAVTVTAIFKGKDNAPFTPKVNTSVYNGTAFGTASAPKIESSVSGWLVTFKQNGVTFDEPTAVGEYQMIASRSADDVYLAAEAKEVGTLRITEAQAVISDVVGTDITTIQTLNQSVISGTANVEGTFSWVNPNTQLTAGTYDDIAVLFTPADDNYAPVSGKAKVNVTALANNVVVRTIELKESDPANGNGVVLALNGTTVTAGTTVKAGDKLTATFSAKSGYTATAKINDTDYTSGTEYVVKDEGNVSIVVTYTKNQTIDPNPGTDPDPDPVVDVTGVSLDKSELTLAVKGTYTLKATVAPADADNKSVTWKSSDDKIATVDKDGKVTAVAIGKATITVTTEDGGKTATCVVTVDAATGLEELIANTRVYGQDHAIRIEPAMSVNVLVVSMNGQLIYNDIVSSATQIPVPAAGIYIVKLGTGNDTSVRKVSVK
ncbi:Ig-like domain-containing protein [Parabacteroides gordonii]|uniref:Ig-like domain-containing protein n=1 Tax=Parabacteroides gordonii TaxID=574930 RepID=UPI000EBB0F1B|nr:Ig-like domain-containing protein [Parabacteroides gordonii]RGP17697.1 T9SS C-terminal target domain-containing protein [Parabacteroides gordonii]